MYYVSITRSSKMMEGIERYTCQCNIAVIEFLVLNLNFKFAGSRSIIEKLEIGSTVVTLCK